MNHPVTPGAREATPEEIERLFAVMADIEPVVLLADPAPRRLPEAQKPRSSVIRRSTEPRVGSPQPEPNRNTGNRRPLRLAEQIGDVAMAMDDQPEGTFDPEEGVEIARITIVRRVYSNDVIDELSAVDSQGNDLALTEGLAMLVLAQDSLLHPSAGRRRS